MNNNNDKHIIIIGAGPAGLSLGYFYNKNGYQVTVIEKSNSVGGLSRGIEFNGNKYDLGPHSFYGNYSFVTKELFKKFIDDNNFEKVKVSKIIKTKKAQFHSPLETIDFFKISNLLFLVKIGLSKVFDTKKNKNKIIEKQGVWTFNNIFKPFCEKYFGRKTEDISDDFFNLLYSNKKNKNEDYILVPNSGYVGEIWENMYDYLCSKNINFLLNDSVKSINLDHERITSLRTTKKEINSVYKLISTIPLPIIYDLIFPNTNFNYKLNFRASIILFTEADEVNTKALYITNYNTDELIGRINFSSNWSNTNSEKVVAIEIWCNKEDDIYKSEDALIIEKIKSELKNNRLIKSKLKNCKLIKIENCFPILDSNYSLEFTKLKTDLNSIKNLNLSGRHGNFMWDGIDDSINNANKLANE